VYEIVEWIQLEQERVQRQASIKKRYTSGFQERTEFLLSFNTDIVCQITISPNRIHYNKVVSHQ
jgi:hypothetical protein